MITPQLLTSHKIISDQIGKPALEIVLAACEQALQQTGEGDVVELGCYIGTTSLFIRRLMDAYPQPARQFHAYDSFEGLPPKTGEDSSAAGIDFKGGELAVSKKQFMEQFKKAGLAPPATHKGWFDQLTASDLPDKIAFAFLDGDFYGSILSSLKLVVPRMVQGSMLTIDDYQREALPGVEKAVADYFGRRPEKLRVSHNIAVLQF